jgi:hypothetical protein
LPAPSSPRTVDPARDVVIVPQDVCPKFGGWICKTQDAQALEEMELIEAETAWKLKLADALGAQFIAEKQRDRALKELDSAGWWKRWGAPLIAGAATAALVVGVVIGRTR